MQIKISTAKKLINNYKQNHWTVINGSCPSLHQNIAYPNVQDSRSVWFNLQDLQNFIDTASQLNADGVRFYFGEYSQDIIQDELLNNPGIIQSVPNFSHYTGLHTLVMIPTTKDQNNVSRDFNINDVNNAGGAPAANLPADFSNGGQLSAENHGSLIPPPYYVGGMVPNIGQDFMLFCDSNP